MSTTEIFDSCVQVRSKKADVGLCSLSAFRVPFDGDDNDENGDSSSPTTSGLGCLQIHVKSQTAEVILIDTLDVDTPLWHLLHGFFTCRDGEEEKSIPFHENTTTALSGLVPSNLTTTDDEDHFKKSTRSVLLHIPGKSASRAVTIQFPTTHDAWTFCLALAVGAVNVLVHRGGVTPTMWIPIPFAPALPIKNEAEEEAITVVGDDAIASVSLRLRRMYVFCADTLIMQQAVDFTSRTEDAPFTTATVSLSEMKADGGLGSCTVSGMVSAFLEVPTSTTKPSAVVALTASTASLSYLTTELAKQFNIGDGGSIQSTTGGEDITTSFANTSFAHNALGDAVAGARGSLRMIPESTSGRVVHVLVLSLVQVNTEESERKARLREKMRAMNSSFVGMGFGGANLLAQRSTSPSLRNSLRIPSPRSGPSSSSVGEDATNTPPNTSPTLLFALKPETRQRGNSGALVALNTAVTTASSEKMKDVTVTKSTVLSDSNSLTTENSNGLNRAATASRTNTTIPKDPATDVAVEAAPAPNTTTSSKPTAMIIQEENKEAVVEEEPQEQQCDPFADTLSGATYQTKTAVEEEAVDGEEEEEEYSYEVLTRMANKLERKKRRLIQREDDLNTMEDEILRRVDLMTQEQSELADERQRLQALIQEQYALKESTQQQLLSPPRVGSSRQGRPQSVASNEDRDDDLASPATPTNPSVLSNDKRPVNFHPVNINPQNVFQPPRSPREFFDKRVLPGRLCDAFPLFTAYIRSVSFHVVPVAFVSIVLILAAILTLVAPLLAVLLPDETFVALPPPSSSSSSLVTEDGGTNTSTIFPDISAMDRSVGEFSLIYFGIQSIILAALIIRQLAFHREDTFNLLHLVDHSLRYHAGTTTAIPYITQSGTPHNEGSRSSSHKSFSFLYLVFWAPLLCLVGLIIPLLVFVAVNNSPTNTTDFCSDPDATPFYFTPLTLLTFFLLAIGNLVGLQMLLVPMGLVAHVLYHRIATCVPQQHGSVFSSVHIRSAMARYHYVRVRLGTRATQLYGSTAGILLIMALAGILFGLVAALWQPFAVGGVDESTGLFARSHPGVVLVGVVATVNALFMLVLTWGGAVGGFRQATQVAIAAMALQCERWTRGDFVAETDMPFLPVAQKRLQQEAASATSTVNPTGNASQSGMFVYSQAITVFTSYCDSSLFAGMGVQFLPHCLQRLCCGIQAVAEPYSSANFDSECHTAVGAVIPPVSAEEKLAARLQKKRLRDMKKRSSLRVDQHDEYTSEYSQHTSFNSNRGVSKKKGGVKIEQESGGITPVPEDDDEDSYSADETTGLVTARPKKQRVVAKMESKPKQQRYSADLINTGGNESFVGGGKIVARDAVGDDDMEAVQDTFTRASTIQLPTLCNLWLIILLIAMLAGISVGALYPTFQHRSQWQALARNPPMCNSSSTPWMWAGEVW